MREAVGWTAMIFEILTLPSSVLDPSKVMSATNLVLIGFLAYLVYFVLSTFSRGKCAKTLGAYKLIQEEYSFVITDDSIERKSSSTHSKIERNGIHHVVLGRKGVYFYISGTQAILIPSRHLDGKYRYSDLVRDITLAYGSKVNNPSKRWK